MNILTILNNVGSFIWKNRKFIPYIAIAVLALLLVQKCNSNKELKKEIKGQKIEKNRIKNNLDAARDTVENLKVNDSVLQGRVEGFKLKMEELKEKHSDLLSDYENLKENPNTIVKKEVVIKDTSEADVKNDIVSDTNGVLRINDDTTFNEGNSRSLSMRVPYFILSVSDNGFDINNSVLFKRADFTLKQRLSLTTGLFEDPETGKVKIKVNTKYPGLKFTKIKGAEITGEDDIPDKLSRDFRKRFGVGLHLGYGYTYGINENSFSRGPQFGVSIKYTPKFLQF